MIVLRSTRARPLCQRWLSTAATAKSYPAEERFPASSTNLRGVPSREHQIERLSGGVEEFDLVVVGGGATGCGAALDAQLRGLNVALVERGDFSSETSSRSTKLVWVMGPAHEGPLGIIRHGFQRKPMGIHEVHRFPPEIR